MLSLKWSTHSNDNQMVWYDTLNNLTKNAFYKITDSFVIYCKVIH